MERHFLYLALAAVLFVASGKANTACFNHADLIDHRTIGGELAKISKQIDGDGKCPIQGELKAAAEKQFANDLFKFGWKMYKSIVQGKSGANVVFSPASLSIALQMAFEGTGGETESEIQQAIFGTKIAKKDIRRGFVSLLEYLRSDPCLDAPDPPHLLFTSNFFYYDTSVKLTNQFRNTLSKCYNTPPITIKFRQLKHKILTLVNNHVSQATFGKINDTLNSNSVSRGTKVLILNSIYFKDQWAQDFSKETLDSEFETSPGDIKVVRTLLMVGSVPYYKNEDLGIQAVAVAYANEQQALYVFLPTATGPGKLEELEQKLSSRLVRHIMGVMKRRDKRETKILLPMFTFGSQLDLKQTLMDLEIQQLFGGNADFGKMIDQKRTRYTGPINVGSVTQKAVIELNENGTVASGVSVVGIMTLSRKENFVANRPFLFMIYNKPTDTIIFMGRVTDPTLSEQM